MCQFVNIVKHLQDWSVFLCKHGVFSSSLTCDSLPSYVLHNNVNITLFRLNSCAAFIHHSKEMYEISYQLRYFKMC